MKTHTSIPGKILTLLIKEFPHQTTSVATQVAISLRVERFCIVLYQVLYCIVLYCIVWHLVRDMKLVEVRPRMVCFS